MTYKTKGVCAQGIEFEIDDNKKVHNIKFTGGCSGNTQGVAHLAEGMDADEVISRLEGIRFIFVSSVRYLFCPIYHTMTGYLLQNGPDLCLGSLHSYG